MPDAAIGVTGVLDFILTWVGGLVDKLERRVYPIQLSIGQFRASRLAHWTAVTPVDIFQSAVYRLHRFQIPVGI